MTINLAIHRTLMQTDCSSKRLELSCSNQYLLQVSLPTRKVLCQYACHARFHLRISHQYIKFLYRLKLNYLGAVDKCKSNSLARYRSRLPKLKSVYIRLFVERFTICFFLCLAYSNVLAAPPQEYLT